MPKLLIIILLIAVFALFAFLIFCIGIFANLSFFKLKYKFISLFSTPAKMDKFNNESIQNAKKNKKEVTIIIHGAVANYYSDMYGAAVWFREQGINAVSFDYDYKATPDVSVQKLSLYVDDILKQTGADKVNIMGVCLGGDLAEYYSKKFGGAKKIDKLITVLSPLKPISENEFFYKIDKLLFRPDLWNKAISYENGEEFVANVLHIYSKKDIVIPTKYQILDKGNFIGVDSDHSVLMNVDPKILNIVLKFINNN